MLAKIFVINLIEELSKGIGLKSLTQDGLWILGIKTMEELLMLCKQISLS
jgi:hypothetical protein